MWIDTIDPVISFHIGMGGNLWGLLKNIWEEGVTDTNGVTKELQALQIVNGLEAVVQHCIATLELLCDFTKNPLEFANNFFMCLTFIHLIME